MMEGLAGKVVIVTGAADGLGRATSRKMAAKGARVLLVDIDEPRLAETEALIGDAGGEAAVFRADVSDETQVRAYVAEAMSRFGRIDAFFNNAGMLGPIVPMIDYPLNTFDRVIAVNLRGVFLGLRFVLPVMIAQRAGSIINTGSMASAGGTPGVIAYNASKHAVIGLTKTAALEVAPTGVRVNAVLPGNIRTRMGLSSDGRADDAETSGSPPGWSRRGEWARRRKSPMPCASWRRMLPRLSPAPSSQSMAVFSPRPMGRLGRPLRSDLNTLGLIGAPEWGRTR